MPAVAAAAVVPAAAAAVPAAAAAVLSCQSVAVARSLGCLQAL